MNKILVLLITLICYPLFAGDTTGVYLIKKENLLKTDSYLASDKLQGRLSGSEGFYSAAEFMAKNFAKLGLKPLGKDGKEYYQYFKTEFNQIIPLCQLNIIENGKVAKKYKLGENFVCRGFSGSGHFTAPIVFVGYGFSEEGYDEYSGLDVKGKIVMMFKQIPGWKIDEKEWKSSLRYREMIAFKKGAVAIIFVSKPNDASPQKPIGSVLDGEGEYISEFPMVHLDLNNADEIITKDNKSIKDLQTIIDDKKQPASYETSTTVEVEVNAKYEKERTTMNVIGLLEGSDPVLKNEYLIIGAHLDHVGGQANEIFFPGANDNASGSSAVLQIATAFAKSERPKRSVIFILFSNEESGLNGAIYYTEHPAVPIEKTIAMFNLDCVGFGDSITVGNGKSAPDLWKIAKENDFKYTKYMIERTWNGGGADATPFHQKGIPCLYFVTNNSYTHLHLTTDKTETLNGELFESITRLAYITAKTVTDGKYLRETIIQ